MNPVQHVRPLWIGLLASAAVAPILGAVLTGWSQYSVMVPPLLVLIVGMLISIPISLFVELPLVLWLRKRGQLSATALCIVGTFAGSMALGVYALKANHWPEMQDQAFARSVAEQAAIQALIPGALFGFVSALAFSVGAGLPLWPSRRTPSASD